MTEIWFNKSLLYNKMICIEFQLAAESQGVVVSNDNYRDLANENMEYKKVVEERLLMYSFVADRFMPPDDPLGRSGPTLDNFLRMQPKYVVYNVKIFTRFLFLLLFLIAMWLFVIHRKSDPQPQCPYGKKCTYGNKCKFYHPERGMGPHKSVRMTTILLLRLVKVIE